MKKILLGTILFFSLIGCSSDENRNDENPKSENIILNKDLINVKPNTVNSFIVKGNFTMKSDKGAYILEENLDGTFKNIPEELNNDEGSINGSEGDTVLLLVYIDISGKVSVGNYVINSKTNPDTGNYTFTSMNFAGNGYEKQEKTGIITATGEHFFTITYTNKYEYYSYVTKRNKQATRVDKRTFTF